MSSEQVNENEVRPQPANAGRRLFLIFFGLLFGTAVSLILLLPNLVTRYPYQLQVGDIAPEDIRAPRQITYVSQIETQNAREAAASAIADIYDPPDPRTGRQQVRKARQIDDFMADVRADPFADTDLKLHYLNAINGLTLTPEEAQSLLDMNDVQYQQVEHEIVGLIEEAMSGQVREGRVDEVTSRLELKVSSDLPEALIPLVVSLAGDLVVPNSALNTAATESARAQAVAAVQDVKHTFQSGEVIVRAGDPLDELDVEALVALGLTARQITWGDVVSAVIVGLLSTVVLIGYLLAFHPGWARGGSHVALVFMLFLVFLLAAQIMVTGQQPVAYLYPAVALALVLQSLVSVEFAVLSAVVLAGLAGYLAGGSLEVAMITAVGGLLAAGSLRRSARLTAYFQSGMVAALGGAAVLLAFHLPDQVELTSLAQPVALMLLNGLLSTGIALVILLVVGSLTDLTTSLQLIDLMRPDHPLQRLLQREAVGTYQHTLEVANLVEAAAEAIRADSLLARVGTLYHDIGKTANPGFFIENRVEGEPDPHQGLSPFASAQILRAHVVDGLELARKHRLPVQVIAFVAEHHGTLPMLFFLDKAQEAAAAAGVELTDVRPFYYDGPIPRSRETALLMLADGCESAVRANRPASSEEIAKIVDRIFRQRIDLGQLDDSGLTLNEIKTVKDTFVRTLRGMYHPRIRYPGDEKPAALLSDEPGAPGQGDQADTSPK